MAGNQVLFSVQVRHPKTVDHVDRAKIYFHRPSGGNVDFVGGRQDVNRLAIVILHLPPPLMAGQFDDQRVRIRGECVNGPAGHDPGAATRREG